jgi:hypothetical protein
LLRLFTELMIFRPRQRPNAIAPQQLLHPFLLRKGLPRFAQRNTIAILQRAPLEAAKPGFDICAA